MILFEIFIALVIAESAALPTNPNRCIVSLKNDLSDPQPLVLVKKGMKVSFVTPDHDGTLRFGANEELRLACVGKGNYLLGAGGEDVQDVAAFCVSGKTFLVNSLSYKFQDLKCKTEVLSVVRRTGKSCLGNYSEVEMGFDLGNEFLRTVEICREDDVYRTIYVKFNLTKAIGGSQKGSRRPAWRQADFWGPHKMNKQYQRAVQRTTVSIILNSTKLGEKYISNVSSFFSRGHLVARSDFVYSTAQRSTFWYINTFPQWQVFNGGNWNSLENSVKDYASRKKLDLEIYTGTHGILTLPDVNNVQRPMYLYAVGEERALEIPLYFWKIVYDPVSKNGTAFVGVNNPYVDEANKAQYRICEDISSRVSYVKWEPERVEKGISYACTIEDLRETVPTLPRLTVVDTLT